jgi:hypothetical protein
VTLVPVTLSHLESIWPLAEPFLFAATLRAPNAPSPLGFLDELRRCDAQLWLACAGHEILGACGTRIEVRYTGERVLHTVWVAGRGFHIWGDLMDQIQAWSKAERGCTRMIYAGRRGWSRLRRRARVIAYVYEETF